VLAHKRASSIGLTVDYKSAGCCASLYAKQLIQNDLIVRALDKGGGFQDLHLEKRRSRRRSLFAQMLRHHVRSSKAHSRLTVKTGALRVAAVSARSSGGDITDRRPWWRCSATVCARRRPAGSVKHTARSRERLTGSSVT